MTGYAAWRDAAGPAASPAAAVLEEYCTTRLERLPQAEQRLAATALDFLVTSHGSKRHCSTADLADAMKLRTPAKLEHTLQALAAEGILRTGDRESEAWYELYHDMYAPILYRWKERFQWKRRRRARIAITLALATAAVIAVGALGLSWAERGRTLANSLDQRAAFAGLQEDRDQEVMFRLAALRADSSDERRRASALATAHLEQLIATFRHDSPIAAVAFTPDGKLAVTAATQGSEPDANDPDFAETTVAMHTSAQAWDLATGNPAGPPWSLPTPASRIALSNSGQLLARHRYTATASAARPRSRSGAALTIPPPPTSAAGRSGSILMRRATVCWFFAASPAAPLGRRSTATAGSL